MQLKTLSFFYWFLLISASVTGQNATVEIGIVTENDLYTSTKNDQYYTNGLEIFYRYLSKKRDSSVLKKINQIRIGQYMYSPRGIFRTERQIFDRPFAGYLFGEFGNTTFYDNQNIFKKYIQAGYVGPNSFADQVQSGTHRLFHYTAYKEWDYQIKNTLSVQVYALFVKPFLKQLNQDRIDFQWQSEAKLGTIFTGISTGFLTRIGIQKLIPLSESNFYAGSISRDKNAAKQELYFYLAPSFNYQIYDATIQGSLFNNNSPVTFDIIPMRFNGEMGLRFRKNNWNLSYAFVYRGKELKSDRMRGYFYGSIGISHLLP